VSLVVLLILAAVWAVFLVPQVLRARAEKTPADSVGAFRRQLSVLERTSPQATAPRYGYGRSRARSPQVSRNWVAKRRRDVLSFLVVAMLATLALSMVPAFGMLLMVHIALDAVFVMYLFLLYRARAISAEREMKVHYLPERHTSPEPVFALQRYGG
jgi:hypothetical protein